MKAAGPGASGGPRDWAVAPAFAEREAEVEEERPVDGISGHLGRKTETGSAGWGIA